MAVSGLSWHSAKIVRLQVALGRPRDLFPCGFHSNTLWQISFWLFRRVCPIQLSLDIIRGQQIPRMFRRHLLTKVCSFCVTLSVTNQVSQPYSRTDLTQALNNLILRCKLMLLALQTFLIIVIFYFVPNSPLNHKKKKISECPKLPYLTVHFLHWFCWESQKFQHSPIKFYSN
jgi:hypothetical protein